MSDGENEPRGRGWRYQPIFDTQDGETLFYLIEVWLDDRERLTAWVSRDQAPLPESFTAWVTRDQAPPLELPFSYPAGESMGRLQVDLVRMYVDSWCWAPVAFDSLRVGMTFRRLVSAEERNRLADGFAATATLLHAAQAANDDVGGKA